MTQVELDYQQALQRYERLHLLWRVVIATLPVDLIVFALYPAPAGGAPAVSAWAPPLLLLLALAAAPQSRIARIFPSLLRLKRAHRALLVAAMAAGFLIPAGAHLLQTIRAGRAANLPALFVTFIFTVGILANFRLALRNERERARSGAGLQQSAKNLESTQRLLHLLPILLARAIPVSALVTAGAVAYPGSFFILHAVAAALLLAQLEPQAESFAVTCRSCGLRASRILFINDQCAECARRQSRRAESKADARHTPPKLRAR